MIKQVTAWMDFKHYPDGSMVVGIECNEPDLTFDGHFVCIFPRGEDETDDTEALMRCEIVLQQMEGTMGIKRMEK